MAKAESGDPLVLWFPAMAEPASEDPLEIWFADMAEAAGGQAEKVWQFLEDGEDWMATHAAMPLYCRVTRRWRGCSEAVARLLTDIDDWVLKVGFDGMSSQHDTGADILSEPTQQRAPESSHGSQPEYTISGGLTSTGHVPRRPPEHVATKLSQRPSLRVRGRGIPNPATLTPKPYTNV